jgi:hopanoid biosynthesis associated protein HpnK
VKRLVVTADDVGLHEGLTLGAVRAHREGIVTACSLAATGPAFDHAVDMLRDSPELDVGVHLTLVESRPISPAGSVPSLVFSDGRFAGGYRSFVFRYALGRIVGGEVERELRAQIERILGAGLSPCHVNSHQHLHVLPGIFEIVARLAREYGIAYVRIPDDHGAAAAPIARRAAVALLGRLGRQARVRAAAHGLHTNDGTIGIACAGHLDAPRLVRLLTCIDGLFELVVHPGVDGESIGRAYPWRYDWDAELAALSSPSVRKTLDREGIVPYHVP